MPSRVIGRFKTKYFVGVVVLVRGTFGKIFIQIGDTPQRAFPCYST